MRPDKRPKTGSDRDAHADPANATCWIVAIARHDSVPELRDLLSVIAPISVTTSPAASWDYGHELSYRGTTVRADASVVRIEIVCYAREAGWVVGAIRKVFARSGVGPMQHVVAMEYPDLAPQRLSPVPAAQSRGARERDSS